MINSEIFKDTPLSEEKIEKVVKFLGRYNKGMYLYPGILLRNLKVSKGEETWILKTLVDNGLVDVLHYYTCPRCGYTTDFYSNSCTHAEKLVCENCEQSMDSSAYKLAYRIK